MRLRPAPVVNQKLAEVLAREPDPIEDLAESQSSAQFIWKMGTADLLIKRGRPVVLACGHFTMTKALHRARCPRCGAMIRAGYDYEAFRHRGAKDDFSWPDDPFRTLHEKPREIAAAVEMAAPMASSSAYDGLRTFADVRATLDEVATHKALCALNDAVEERFMRDRQQLAMTDEDWEQWTLLVAHKAAQLEDRDDGARPRGEGRG